MIYLCKCGRFKSGSPFKASGTKDWICETCAKRTSKQHKAAPSVIIQRIRTLDILKKKRIS